MRLKLQVLVAVIVSDACIPNHPETPNLRSVCMWNSYANLNTEIVPRLLSDHES